MILERFFPDIYLPSVYDLPLETLREMGIRGLVFDIDNTIAPFDVADPDEKLIAYFAHLRAQGFRLCILSNNNQKRVHRFNQPLRTLAIHKAGKPSPRKLKTALAKLGLVPQEAALVGDQVFTDMWCGHRGGLYCIMTAPICARDQLITKVKRGAERCVMRVYFRRNGIAQPPKAQKNL